MSLYFCMGYLVFVALGPLRQTFPPAALEWLFGGGVAYTLGAIILGADRPHLWPGKFSAHDITLAIGGGDDKCRTPDAEAVPRP